MDFYAYSQIEDLEEIAKDNGIEVPRLRGYRLMKSEASITDEEIQEMIRNAAVRECETLCRSTPFWNANSCTAECSSLTDFYCNQYLMKGKTKDGYEDYVGIKWDKIHGRKRKVLKFEIKKAKKRILRQYEMWNKYAGKENILYIHSRIGGANWDYYNGNKLTKEPWFLDKVDDSFDSTYCDIYALIGKQTQ